MKGLPVRYNSDDWLCRNMMKNNNANENVKKDVQQKRLIPLWAMVLGPLWIPVLLAMLAICSFVMVVWVIPVSVASGVFGWKLPQNIFPKWMGMDDTDQGY